MSELTVVLRSKRRERAQLVQRLQHTIAAFALLTDGLHVFWTPVAGVTRAIALAEVVSGAALLFLVARAVRAAFRQPAARAPHAHAHRVDATELATAAMLAIEAVARRRETGHLSRPTVLMAVIFGVMAFAHDRLDRWAQRRSVLRITDDGLSIGRRRPWQRRVSLGWSEISRLDLADDEAHIVATDGWTRRIDLADVFDAKAVVGALEVARGRLAARSARGA